MMEAQNKEERIEIRISSQDKRTFKKAQKLSGDKTFSGFVIRIIRKQAESIIKEKERILVSDRDRKIFFDAIYGNLDPNENLVAASKKYKARISSK